MARTLVEMFIARATASRHAIRWLYEPLLLRNVFDVGCHSSTLYTGRSSEIRRACAFCSGYDRTSPRERAFRLPVALRHGECRVSSSLLDSPAAVRNRPVFSLEYEYRLPSTGNSIDATGETIAHEENRDRAQFRMDRLGSHFRSTCCRRVLP